MSKTKTLFFFFMLVLLSANTFVSAQNGQQNDYLVLQTGDTLYGKVGYINEKAVNRDFHKKIRLTDAQGKTKKYNWKQVSGFRWDGFDYESFWLSKNSPSGLTLTEPRHDIDYSDGTQFFLKVISKGNVSHYELEWFNQGNSTLWSKALLKKKKDPFLIRADLGLLGLKRKVLHKYFSDCPELQEKLEQKEFRKVSEVVAFYNGNCVE
ncbi:hypothetical protein LV716_16110 [Flagellimonas sp. HMM57]|uniref:hypothetical protein n=1 Tax=unclassified Flagellimonas TaxID=2644544 RepID=UPI0013D17732|nr:MULTISPECIES: hypothetical protein [unclassified Flagellimonas]UII75766.1 hypothetical protein LV716_16110 [Flagellimonas sp. HMM57]